jgi:glycosyltransferase involved in cell wall biosynthesis
VLNTHFASGYGTLARLSGFRPNVLSVWGSDVYDFPEKSLLHKKLICNNLKNADWVCSTSHVMAERTRQLYPVEKLNVIPFGIDTTVFAPQPKPATLGLTIGTVKSLAPKYGIDLLITAFAELRSMLQPTHPELATALRLLIVGGGPEEAALKQVAAEAGVASVTTFTGKVPHSEVPSYLNRLDIYVALSRSESFGVAVLEASSCALPVVVANTGGLPEVVKDGETGFVVPCEDSAAAALALQRLTVNPELRQHMGRAGRQHVMSSYAWEQSVAQLEEILYRFAKRER